MYEDKDIPLYINKRGTPAIGPIPSFNIATWVTSKPSFSLSTVKRERINFMRSQYSTFVDEMVEAIKKLPVLLVHSKRSSYFYNLDYYDKWCKIFQKLPSTRFIVFYKSHHDEITRENFIFPNVHLILYNIIFTENIDLVRTSASRIWSGSYMQGDSYICKNNKKYITCFTCRYCFNNGAVMNNEQYNCPF